MKKAMSGIIFVAIAAAVAAVITQFLIEDKEEKNLKAVKFHQRNYATIK